MLALIASVIGAFVYLRILLLALKKPTVSIRIQLSVEQIIVIVLTSIASIGAIYFI